MFTLIIETYTSTVHTSSMFLSSHINRIFNQSGRIFSYDRFLNLYVIFCFTYIVSNLLPGDIMQLQFVKSTLTVNPCMVSERSTKQFIFYFQREFCSFLVEHSLTLARNNCCSQVKQTSEDPGSFLAYMYKCKCNLTSFIFPLFATILWHAFSLSSDILIYYIGEDMLV